MHHFERGQSPVDLPKVARHYVNWKAFDNSHEHRLVGDVLYERQHHYCAYCETLLMRKTDGFIEHLARRSDFPQRTFDWSNIFFCCKHNDSCGNYKDNQKIQFNVRDIIDPSLEHPQDFFIFDRVGHISPRTDLTADDEKRAKETIRVLNLNNSKRLLSLRQKAAKAVACFLEIDTHPDESAINRFLEMVGDVDCLSVYYSLLGRRMP